MKKYLVGGKEYKIIKEKSDAIKIIKLIKRICYNYQLHKFAPLGGRESLDRLATIRQPEDMLESNHYDKFKTVIEVCKASGIKFAVM